MLLNYCVPCFFFWRLFMRKKKKKKEKKQPTTQTIQLYFIDVLNTFRACARNYRRGSALHSFSNTLRNIQWVIFLFGGFPSELLRMNEIHSLWGETNNRYLVKETCIFFLYEKCKKHYLSIWLVPCWADRKYEEKHWCFAWRRVVLAFSQKPQTPSPDSEVLYGLIWYLSSKLKVRNKSLTYLDLCNGTKAHSQKSLFKENDKTFYCDAVFREYILVSFLFLTPENS